METLLFDFRDAIRAIRRDRSYGMAVVATLALTLGASTAVFSIVNGVLLRPLDYPDASSLVSIREVVPAVAEYPTLPANGRHFEEWRRRTTSFESITLIERRTTTLVGVGEAAQVDIVRASGSLFDVLRMPVALGRPLAVADERPDRPLVTVISSQLWEQRFGRDPGVLGRPLTLGGRQYTIVGVTAPGAEVPVLQPLSEAAFLSAEFAAIVPSRLNLDTIGWMGQFNYPVLGRLKPGVTLAQARAELDVVQQAVSDITAREIGQDVALRGWIQPLEQSIAGRVRLGLLLLLGTIGGVVLIACANLANLSLTRALARVRDTAVRTALGASRRRLMLGIVYEQLLLALAGGALGLFVARESLRVFVRTAPTALPRPGAAAIDGRVVAFAIVVSILAGLCVALIPAWRIARGNVQQALRGGGHGTTDRGGLRVRATLLTVQVALSVTLLAVTGLFAASFLQLMNVDSGFSTDRVLAVEIAPVAARYPDEPERAVLYDRILARVKEVSAITSASWTSSFPLTGETWVDAVAEPGDTRPPSQKPSANYQFVGPEYFRTLSMPLTRGRSIDERDRSRSVPAAVISARTAETLWPDRDPIGRLFTRGDPAARFEVVGVVADGHPTSLETEPPLMVYVPYWYLNEGKSVLLVQTAGDPTSVAGELRRIIHSIDPEIAIPSLAPLQHVVDKALASRRYQMWLFTAFGGVALLIATVGVYGTTAFGVSRRRREMNLRVALGARASQVFGLVVRQSAVPLFAGLLLGAAGASATGTVVASLLFQVSPSDPMVIAIVVALVGSVGLAAAALAARQGLQIDPAAALRGE